LWVHAKKVARNGRLGTRVEAEAPGISAFVTSPTAGSFFGVVAKKVTIGAWSEVLPKISDPSKASDDATAPVKLDDSVKSWNGRAADLLAIWIVLYCNPLLLLARRTFVFLAFVALLFLLAATAYPAQPQGLLGRTAVTMIAVVGLLTVVLIYQIEHNELINLLAHTDPNRITWDFGFITQSLLLLVIPATVLVGTWFPDAADWLQKLVDPLSRLVK
jgi:hypothetical protein